MSQLMGHCLFPHYNDQELSRIVLRLVRQVPHLSVAASRATAHTLIVIMTVLVVKIIDGTGNGYATVIVAKATPSESFQQEKQLHGKPSSIHEGGYMREEYDSSMPARILMRRN
jgi:hypothetical protein